MPRQDRPQARRPRPRDDAASVAGTELVVEVGPPAHGGHAVARSEGRVVFVRHALPGERVRARVTQGRPGDSFWRADVAEVLEASPDRVAPPCPLAVPGGCGGCDLQHVAVAAQREWKGAVVSDLLLRVGKLTADELPQVVVEVLPGPGEHDNLRWRGRQRFAVAPDGRLGLRTHRGHRVVPIEDCPISAPDVMATGVTTQPWPGAAEVAVATGDDTALVVVDRSLEGRGTLPPPGWSRPEGVSLVVTGPSAAEAPRPPHRAGRSWVSHAVPGVEGTFRVTGSGFWQAHPGAAPTYVQAIRDAVAARPGQTVLDLYSGSGLFAAAMADDVGTTGRVISVEGDPAAVADARRNLHTRPQIEILEGDVEAALLALAPDAATVDDGAVAADAAAAEQTPLDAVVLDPPRSGAGHAVVDALCALEPRVVAYVACDPAALARDVARFAGHGYRLTGLRAFDAFPMTHHVECVATLTRQPEPSGSAGPQAVRQDGTRDAEDGLASATTTSEGPA